MRYRSLRLSLVALTTAATAALAADGGPSANYPITNRTFFDTGVGLQAAAAHGDLQKGTHGTYVKMPAGFISKSHTHTEDYVAVVISGVGANGLPDAADVALPAGSSWFQKGEEVHVTKCLSSVDCLFFVVQPGKFDYVFAK